MSRNPGAVLRKTALGLDELDSRRRGLDPRARQLLILIDGRRNLDELARMLPQDQLDARLAMLEAGGFVEAAADPDPTDGAPENDEFPRHRQRVARALLDACGSSGDEFAIRIGRCTAAAELRELLPAALELAEAIGGRAASREFARRVRAVAPDFDASAARL
ncbi:MAG TPA: hypothetical protein VIT02_02005 [Burkholderiaceae bacterium]